MIFNLKQYTIGFLNYCQSLGDSWFSTVNTISHYLVFHTSAPRTAQWWSSTGHQGQPNGGVVWGPKVSTRDSPMVEWYGAPGTAQWWSGTGPQSKHCLWNKNYWISLISGAAILCTKWHTLVPCMWVKLVKSCLYRKLTMQSISCTLEVKNVYLVYLDNKINGYFNYFLVSFPFELEY